MSKRKEIFKDAGIYSVSMYIAQFFDMVNGVLVRRFLGPADMGVWTFLQVIQNYAKHSNLGVTTATLRDVPYFREKGETAKAEEIKNLVYSFTLLTALASAAVIVFIAFVQRRHYPEPVFYGLLVVAALLVVQRVYNLFIVLLRAHKEFVFSGLLNIFSSAASVVLTVLLTWRFHLYGFFAAMILNYLLTIALVFLKTPYRFSFYLNGRALLPLLGLGFAVLIADILRSVFMSIDRLVITKYLGFEALGLYSVALMADNYLYSLPNMLGVIFFPHFQEAFAKRDNPQDLEKYMRQPTVAIAYFFPLVIGLVWCVSDWLIPLVLPQYRAGIAAVKILSAGSIFLALTHVFSTFLITTRRHWLLIPINAAVIPVGFLLSLAAVRHGYGIEGIALAKGALSLLYFVLLSLICLRGICSYREILAKYRKIFLISGYFIAILLLADRLGAAWPPGFFKSLNLYAMFLVLMAPVLWAAEKETHVFKTAWELLQHKFLSPSKKGGPLP